jgi:PIN like domain
VARKDVIHTGHPLILPEVPLGALDTEWIPPVAARGLAVISRDRHIRTKPGELRLLQKHGVRVFWIAGKKDIGTWDALTRLVYGWADIELRLQDRPRSLVHGGERNCGQRDQSLAGCRRRELIPA